MGGTLVQVQLGYGGHWLAPPAAKSVTRISRQIGHNLQITEAGRDWATQNGHWQRYLAYLNGGPWAPIALSPDAPSIHQLGGAVDSDEAQRILAVMEDHGWRRTVYRNGKLVEPWHFEYFEHLDNHRGEVVELEQGTDGVWRIAQPRPAATEKGEDMRVVENGQGGQMFMDELGADNIGSYFYVPNGPDATPSWVDNILASWALAGQTKPDTITGWQFELARHQANARWAQKRGEIVTDTVNALKPLFSALGEAIAGLDPKRLEELIQQGLQDVVVEVQPLSEADVKRMAEATRDQFRQEPLA